MTSETNYIIFRNEKNLENDIKHVIKICAIGKENFHNSDFNSDLA